MLGSVTEYKSVVTTNNVQVLKYSDGVLGTPKKVAQASARVTTNDVQVLTVQQRGGTPEKYNKQVQVASAASVT